MFEIGELMQTRGIAAACKDDPGFTDEVMQAFSRYRRGNWGDLEECDKQANDSAVKNNDDRILARYNLSKGDIYILTERDRSYTTVMFCNEY